MDFLEYLYGLLTGGASSPFQAKPRIDSEGQLRRAQQEQAAATKYDQEARAAGFNNGQEYLAYLKQRQNRSGGTVEGRNRAPAGVGAAMAWHPARTIQRAADALKGANKRGN